MSKSSTSEINSSGASAGVVKEGGGCVGGLTVTVNDAIAVLSAASVAAHSTTVPPTGNSVREAGSHEMAMLPPMSYYVIAISLLLVILDNTQSHVFLLSLLSLKK